LPRERFAEQAAWGVNYLRLTFSRSGRQVYFAEAVLRVQARG
jgi:hypothetical protein